MAQVALSSLYQGKMQASCFVFRSVRYRTLIVQSLPTAQLKSDPSPNPLLEDFRIAPCAVFLNESHFLGPVAVPSDEDISKPRTLFRSAKKGERSGSIR
ncbi:hypothetical protein [Roseibium sp.]|uniref:hypothetical protein n=1 Tax=Roseibium sp. TaxID=1936156 RepID=UPI003A96F0B2